MFKRVWQWYLDAVTVPVCDGNAPREIIMSFDPSGFVPTVMWWEVTTTTGEPDDDPPSRQFEFAA